MISFRNKTRHTTGPDITPLLDVVFILLIFFVVSAVFTLKGMDMELPKAETSQSISGRCLEIVLRADGSLLMDGAEATLLDVRYALDHAAALSQSARPGQIVLKADPHSQVQPFLDLVDLVRKHGFQNLVIATRSLSSPEADS